MEAILAGHAMWGALDSLPDHVHVVTAPFEDEDEGPWAPFAPGWQDLPDDGEPMSPGYPDDLLSEEMSYEELLRDAAYAALVAQRAGVVTGPALVDEDGVTDPALDSAYALAELVDAGYRHRAAELAERGPAEQARLTGDSAVRFQQVRNALDTRFETGIAGVAA